MSKQKYYVVWEGVEDGVYTTWEACQEAVKGFSGAKYMAFKDENEAEEAYAMGYEAYMERAVKAKAASAEAAASHDASSSSAQCGASSPSAQCSSSSAPVLPAAAIRDAIAVDAACSGNPGAMEYRGVYLRTGKEIFHFGPMFGTNNIGEFLAIVHALALLHQKGSNIPIYSDSRNALMWVKDKKCKTKLPRDEKSEELFKLIDRAENWLRTHSYSNPLIKWETAEWGEIPADFGRK